MKVLKIFILISFFLILIDFTILAESSSPKIFTKTSSESTISTKSSSIGSEGININKPFELTLEKKVQDVFSKSIPIKLTIASKIQADRLEIEWTFNPENLSILDSKDVFTSIKQGEVKTMTYNFVPLKKSENRVFVRVQAWQNDANYTITGYIDLNFDANFEIIPQSEEFKNNQQVWNIVLFGIVLISIVLGIVVLIKIIKKFRTWYEKD